MDEKVVFRRSAARQLFEGVAVTVGAIAFLGAAVAMATGAMGDGQDFTIGIVLFGFFGVLMAFGAVTAVSRGRETRVAEVGPAGVWPPEMEFLPWSEIAEVRLERIYGSGGRYQRSPREYQRLGFVPVNSSLHPRASTFAAWAMVQAYFSALRARAPQLGLGAGSSAPFGVLEPEIEGDFDRLVELVRQHIPVRDATS